MPYDYYDANGFLALGPTVPQWEAMRPQLTGAQGTRLAETGTTALPLALADEIPDDAPPLLAKLKAAAERADTTLSIASGTRAEEA
jgi:hypothetical protein